MAQAGMIAMLCPLFRGATQATTLNEWQNDVAFLALATCLGIGLMLRLTDGIIPAEGQIPLARTLRICLCVGAACWGSVVLAYEARAAWTRTVQQFAWETRFDESIRVPRLDGLRWGEPMRIGEGTARLRKGDLEGLFSYLAAKRSNFFVMGDAAILYGLVGTVSPQPLLYFSPGHSFSAEQIPRLDRMISAGLIRNGVSVVVREKVTWRPDIAESYGEFPRTQTWFTSGFVHVRDFGNFEIWERKPERS
jgi:hypothetical protein